jgi:hypothetical protein
MSELRLRDDQGRFVSETEENAYMNGILRGLAGGGAPPAPTPTPPTNGAGQPVPPGAGPEPREDENTVMNRCLKEMCGIADANSR